MNNLYEFGGSCDVIIRCNSERTIGGQLYQAGEPYTILEDVLVDLQYTTINSEESGKKTVISSREGYPNFINIRGLTLTTKISNLIATQTVPQPKGQTCIIKALDGKLFFPEKTNGKNIFVYDNKNNLFADFNIDDECEFLYGTFEEGKTYRVFYEVNSNNSCFNFDIPHYGYFTVEIIGTGNSDKVTNNIYMKFPVCSLISAPVFNMVNGTILNSPLQFQCIYKSQPNPYFSFGE